jgi:antitoxin HicB
MKIAYRCAIEKQADGKFLVTFPNFEEAFTEGDTYEEAFLNAEEVLTLTLEGRLEEDIPVPLPDLFVEKNEKLVFPSPRLQSALLVKFSRGDRTLADLARTLETSWPSVARLEDPHHWSSLKQLSKTATALGQKLVLSFENHQR